MLPFTSKATHIVQMGIPPSHYLFPRMKDMQYLKLEKMQYYLIRSALRFYAVCSHY